MLRHAARPTRRRRCAEFADLGKRIAEGAKLFGEIKDEDVQIATTPTRTRSCARTSHALPLQARSPKPRSTTPVLIVYGLIGRYTMADLQEDRSLVRNLLALGVDLYVVDWGNPTPQRPLADASRTMSTTTSPSASPSHLRAARHRPGQPARHLRGRRVHACYAALYPDTRQEPGPHHHADRLPRRPGARSASDHGFINLWTRSLTPEDIDRLIEANGNLPGELMSFVFSLMTPCATLIEVQPRPARRHGRREEAARTSCAWRSGSPTGRTIPARRPSNG